MQPDLTNIVFPDKLSVTEQDIDVSFLSDKQKQFYINLFIQLINIYTEKRKQRLIIGVSGPSGSGKSVISMLFMEIAKQVALPFNLKAISIDAFHYPNKILTTTFTKEGTSLKEHKGRFDTYETEKLAGKLEQFSLGENVSFPLYSRGIHDPVEDVIEVNTQNTLLIVEGLWILYQNDGWKKIGKFIDYSIFVTANKEKTKELVISRHIRGGRTFADASNYFNTVDSINFDLVMETKNNADMIIPPFYEIH